ncbi:hypothetical protein GCM10027168_60810 [Streptomyces capparidis]
MKMMKALVAPIAALAVMGGATAAHAGGNGFTYAENDSFFPCGQVPIIPIVVLSGYKQKADCSQEVNDIEVYDIRYNKQQGKDNRYASFRR